MGEESTVPPGIAAYNAALPEPFRLIAEALLPEIVAGLPGAEARVWHRMAVWFIDANPIVGYAPRKAHLTLLFWSGQSFDEPGLRPEGTFRAAEVHLAAADRIDRAALARWLGKAARIQWDYRNLIRRKGRLEKIGDW